MIALSAAAQTALAERAVVARDMVWFTVRDRDTNAPFSDGYWSDRDDVTATVIDPATGGAVSRLYRAGGALVAVGGIPRVAGTAVQSITLRLSQVVDRINDLLRGYDPRQGRVEIHRALFNATTRALVADPFPRFYGWIDRVDITTPAEGGEGGVSVVCVSDVREMGRSNPATRSDASQRARSATDSFYADAATAGELPIFWGARQR